MCLPSVSILLLCWNHKPYLERSISALANQTDRHFQTIFLDNASSDGSFECAQALFRRFSLNVTLLRNPEPRGISINLNKLLMHATNDLVCPISADDWYLPEFVETMRSHAATNQNAAWFFGQRATTTSTGSCWEAEDYSYIEGEVWPSFLQGKFNVNFNGTAIRRSSLNAIDGWDEQMPVEDIDLFFRLAENGGRCEWVKKPLAVYLDHPNSISKDISYMVDGLEAFFKKHARWFPFGGRAHFADVVRQMAASAVDTGQYKIASQLLSRSFVIFPPNFKLIRTALYLFRGLIRKLKSSG